MSLLIKNGKSALKHLTGLTLFLVVGNALAVDCSPDDITLSTQAAVNDFQANHGPCDTVVGGMEISGSDVTSLLPLSDLSVVNGFLNVFGTSLETLEGLSGLEHVGEWIQFHSNDDLLNLDGFPEISFASINIFGNDSLENIDGLSYLSGEIGSFSLFWNPQLGNVDALLGVTRITGHLYVGSNALTNLHGFSNLERVDGVVNISGDSLVSLDGLENLNSIGRFISIGESFPYTFGFTKIENLDGLSGLTVVGESVLIGGNSELTNIDGLSNLKTIGTNFIVADNRFLTNIDAVSGVTTWGGGARIERNEQLTDISALSNIPSSIAYLTITENELLEDISPLSHLTEIRGNVIVRDTSISDISPLSGILSVDGDFILRLNSQLAKCYPLQRLLDRIDDAEPGPGPNLMGIPDIGGEVDIGQNLPGCNSLDEVLGVFLRNGFE